MFRHKNNSSASHYVWSHKPKEHILYQIPKFYDIHCKHCKYEQVMNIENYFQINRGDSQIKMYLDDESDISRIIGSSKSSEKFSHDFPEIMKFVI